MAHPGIHHSGCMATTRSNGWEASGREAPGTRPAIGKHLLSCERQCGKVWALFNQFIYYLSAQQCSTKSWFPPMQMSPACWRVMDVYVRVREEESTCPLPNSYSHGCLLTHCTLPLRPLSWRKSRGDEPKSTRVSRRGKKKKKKNVLRGYFSPASRWLSLFTLWNITEYFQPWGWHHKHVKQINE